MEHLNVPLNFMNMKTETLNEKVEFALEQLRPYLRSDGGDMELVEITEDKIVKVKLLGACKTCTMSNMTLKAGLEEALKNSAPEIKGIMAVE